ncbi:nuclease-related domain-containing protein [Neisseria sp. 83E34]|uniref:nuclease-related domain-containing protein n=1 Tax=Neisseria sp. 83E34 TaxID=1692264 RepID=UPI0006CE9F82|nr:nuclease-related domain-containing protein [Neisseria sp. 83E34]KPN72151.1 nuclease [Neisseria sp. 83E34]
MIIKQGHNREHDIEDLNTLLALPYIDSDTKDKISREIRNIQSGIKGEKEAAYHMNFQWSESKNWMVIHDLRLEYKGHVAQIDHLLLNRFMEIYVCESKRFGEGIAINEHGEFSAFYKGKSYGIPSPIEQNNHHIKLLQRLFDSDCIELPIRLGVKMKPKLISLILIANSARISRPKNEKSVESLDRIIKNEQIVKKINRDIDDENIFSMVRSVSKIISPETLQSFAESLAALHRPLEMNWRARFGINEPAESDPVKAEHVDSVQSQDEIQHQADVQDNAPNAAPARLFCAGCKKTVSPKVANFCWSNKARFQGRVYCYNCQRSIKKTVD